MSTFKERYGDERLYVHRVGRRILRHRLQRGWSQERLAEKIGRSQPTVMHWEKGKTHPRPGAILALARAFEIHPDELVTYRRLEGEP
jgi:transcriptional regulator with XRE-family HTH domain